MGHPTITTKPQADPGEPAGQPAGQSPGQPGGQSPGEPPAPDLVWVPGGSFAMGSDRHYPEEAPAHRVTVDGFWMDRMQVTNADFAQFVEDTGYLTVAEQAPSPAAYPGAKPELLVPGSVAFVPPPHRVDLREWSNWWAWVPGAGWRHPEGPDSSLEGREEHPVVHVAYPDVVAYLDWAGRVLPTEAEWEFAARGGLDGAEYAWGDELAPGGKHLANTWQGEFPTQNLLEDGYERTAPAGSYPPNGYGLHDLIGNVWEWTQDWYRDRHLVPSGSCCAPGNPRGPSKNRSYDPATPQIRIPRKVVKGGSFMCAPNYCRRYRPAARMPQAVDTGTANIGFRGIVRAAGRRAG